MRMRDRGTDNSSCFAKSAGADCIIRHFGRFAEEARLRIEAAGYRNVEFREADMFDLPFAAGQFDHIFLCFVLEHVAEPATALGAIQRVLRRDGTITVIEGDHGSWHSYPQTAESSRAVRCLIDLQARLGGDSLIGPGFIRCLLGLDSATYRSARGWSMSIAAGPSWWKVFPRTHS